MGDPSVGSADAVRWSCRSCRCGRWAGRGARGPRVHGDGARLQVGVERVYALGQVQHDVVAVRFLDGDRFGGFGDLVGEIVGRGDDVAVGNGQDGLVVGGPALVLATV